MASSKNIAFYLFAIALTISLVLAGAPEGQFATVRESSSVFSQGGRIVFLTKDWESEIVDQAFGEADDIKLESRKASLLEYLLKITNATTLEELEYPETFHTVKLDFGDWDELPSSLGALKYFTQPEIRGAVHELILSGFYLDGTKWIMPYLEDAIPLLENLETLRWDADPLPISPSILRSLERLNQGFKLHYTLPLVRSLGDQADPEAAYLKPLIPNSTVLHSLKASIEYGDSLDHRLRQVFDTVVSSPNLKELDLAFSKGRPLWTNAFDFQSNHGARFPPLEVLRLHGYELDSTSDDDQHEASEDGNDAAADITKADITDAGITDAVIMNALKAELRRSRAQQIFSKPKRSTRPNIEEWLEHMDWSQLRTLDLSMQSFGGLESLRGAVPRLQNLALVGGSASDATPIVDFIANTDLHLESLTLAELKIESLDNLLATITHQHGPSLKQLALTGRGDSHLYEPLLLSQDSLAQLNVSCPRLESLTVGFPATNSEWDYSLLHTLIAHPHLRHLTLHVDIPQSDPSQLEPTEGSNNLQPLFNATSTPGLFRYLRKQKKELSDLVQLETLTVRVTARSSYRRYFCTLEEHEFDLLETRYDCFVNHMGAEVCGSPPRRDVFSRSWMFDGGCTMCSF